MSFFAHDENQVQRKLEQDKVIDKVVLMEQCMQCYINKRLETLLLPFVKKAQYKQ